MKEIDTETAERLLTFMESMAPEQTAFLNRLEEEATGDAVPIIRTQTRSLILFLLELLHPRRILEIGTGTGFSACLMLTYAPGEVRITTIERDPGRIRKAKENFARMDEEAEAVPGRGSRQITLLEGDAGELLPGLDGPYEFIFMDAAKGQYIHFLPEMKRLLAPGGVLLSDNILVGGEILASRYAVKRRDRTIHRRMREYLEALTHDPELRTLLLQEGDGAALSLKKLAEPPKKADF